MGEPDEFVSEIEQRRYCHTCGQPYTGDACTRRQLHTKIDRWRNSIRPAVDPEQWAADHTGACGAGTTPCGRPARLYADGWRCEQHPPAGSTAATRA